MILAIFKPMILAIFTLMILAIFRPMILAIFKQSDFCSGQVTVLHPALQQASGVFRATRQVENTVCYIQGVLKKATNITFCDQNRNAPTHSYYPESAENC